MFWYTSSNILTVPHMHCLSIICKVWTPIISRLFIFLNVYVYVLTCVCVYVRMYMLYCMYIEVRGQLVVLDYLLLPCEPQVLNSASQACRQEPLTNWAIMFIFLIKRIFYTIYSDYNFPSSTPPRFIQLSHTLKFTPFLSLFLVRIQTTKTINNNSK